MSEKLILGIDGGGTNTVAWIAPADDTGQILGRGMSGPSNPQVVGAETAIKHLGQAIEEAFTNAELSRRPFTAACIGLAGADRDADQRMIQRWAAHSQLADQLHVVNDALPVLFCANADGCGVALISGTGSFAFGRREDGVTARAGGWGYLFDDEGSAYAIAVEGLRAVAKSLDGRGPSTALVETFLTALGGIRAEELISAIYDPAMTRSRIASLCHLVFESYEADDPVATQIVDTAACRLAEMVAAVASQLDPENRPFPLALTGGVLLNNRELRSRLQSALRNNGLTVDPIKMIPNPVAGALSISQQSVFGKFPQSLSPPTSGLDP